MPWVNSFTINAKPIFNRILNAATTAKDIKNIGERNKRLKSIFIKLAIMVTSRYAEVVILERDILDCQLADSDSAFNKLFV